MACRRFLKARRHSRVVRKVRRRLRRRLHRRQWLLRPTASATISMRTTRIWTVKSSTGKKSRTSIVRIRPWARPRCLAMRRDQRVQAVQALREHVVPVDGAVAVDGGLGRVVAGTVEIVRRRHNRLAA